MKSLTLIPGQLSLSQLRDVYSHPVNITLDSGAFAAIDESVACVNAILAEGRTAYGINTGFGLLAQTRISTEDLENLQRSLVLSHAAGVGEPLDDDLARLIMVLKINSLSRGFSGIRLSVIQALIGLVNAGVTPWIPAKGSVGASGDLAPLAHMSLTLIGEGKARVRGGDWLPATEALRQVGLENYAHAWPDELSGGMRQRVGLARALAINPDILLMDEAFSALDPLIRTEMQDELIKLQAKHQRTIVFISHDLDEAMRIGDRIAIMQNGEVVQVGTPDEILNNPANDYVRTFFRGVDISQVFSAKDIARRSPVGLIRKTPGFGPRSALKLLQDEDREYGYVIERGNRFVGIVSIDSLKTALSAGQGIEAALIDAPLAVEAQTPLSDLLSHVGHAPCAVPVVDEEQQYIGIISKRMLLQALDREGVNHG